MTSRRTRGPGMKFMNRTTNTLKPAQKRVRFVFAVANVACLLAVLELWREGQPLDQTVVTGLVSIPGVNLILWFWWRRIKR